jgi:hypothetical protein
MKTGFRSGIFAGRIGWRLAGIAALFAPAILLMMPTPASAVDLRGLIGTAIAMHALQHGPYYGRATSHHASGGHVTAKRDRDSDEADDADASDHGRKSADASSQHQPSKPAHPTHEVAQTGSGADTMVSLDRSQDEPAFSPSR